MLKSSDTTLKINFLASLKTKLILALSLFILLAALATTFTVYEYLFDSIKKDRLHDLGQVAYNRHQLLINELTNLNRSGANLLYRAIRLCEVEKKKERFDEDCLKQRLAMQLKIERPLGLLLYSRSSGSYWSEGEISVGEAINLNFVRGQLARFQPRGISNEPRSFYVLTEDKSTDLRLVIKYKLDLIQEIFASAKEVGKSGETFLADGNGYFITEPKYHSHDVGLASGINVEPMRVCLEKKNTELLGLDYRGAKIIHGFRYVPEIGGGCIMAHIDQAEAFAAVFSLRREIAAGCGVFVLISFSLLYLFSIYVVDPLKYLANVAHSISNGNYKLKSAIQRKDEIGLLSNAFNQMTSILLQAENKFKLAVENIHDYAITILDTNGYIMNWNRGIEKIIGYRENEIIGQHYSCFFTKAEQLARHPERNLKLALQFGSYEEESQRVRKNGEQFVANVIVTAIFDEQRIHRGYIKITRDITEKKKLEISEMQAQKANIQKTSFLACMSHEIRTPLNSIIGVTELLLEKKLNQEDQQLLGVAHAAGETLLAIINDILDLSRIEAGEARLENVEFSLAEQISVCLSMMDIRAKEKKISLKFKIQDSIGDRYRGDPTRLRQIVINLLSNALKFSERGEVIIKVSPGIGAFSNSNVAQLLFSVADEGLGIPESQRQVIFERFKQADESVTRRFGGTGLGLSITKRLVEMMNGKIWVESTVGKGSVFYFTVQLQYPLAPELSGSPSGATGHLDKSVTAVPKPPVASRPLRILMAEDSEDNQLIFRSFLKGMGHSITMVANGQAAFERFQENRFDLVFMDVQMPILDGYSATIQIRNWEKLHRQSSCPIIALTANALAEDVRMSLAAGCDHHMSKPLRKEVLLALVAKYAQPPAANGTAKALIDDTHRSADSPIG
jgi:PAS domain S-box-containing protein